MDPLSDMHCHLAFSPDGPAVAAQARDQGTLLFANTVSPGEWRQARRVFAPYENVAVGFGLHPWWVPKEDFTAATLTSLLDKERPRLLGEMGLDFGPRHRESAAQQAELFRAAMSWAAAAGNRLISLHSVHASAEVLDILDASRALDRCTCVFHWFTGPSDLLKRAIQRGCYFSCGPRMLKTGKGREYVKAIPAGRLLLESDWPPQAGDRCTFPELYSQLQQAADGIAAIKGDECLAEIERTTRSLIGP